MEWSALVYILLAVVTVTLGLCVSRAGEPAETIAVGKPMTRYKARKIVVETAVFVLLAGVSACRIAVGNDYWVYRDNFKLIAQQRHVASEFGFNAIVRWMQLLFGYDNYLPIFGLFSIVTAFFFVKALHDQADDFAFSLFLLLAGGYYYNSLNSVRYYLALAIALYSMKYVIGREYGKFLLWILAGAMFHKSILLVLLVYPVARYLAQKKLRTWQYIVGILLVFSLIFGQTFYREIIFRIYPFYRDSVFDNGRISYVNIAKCLGTLFLCGICYKRSLVDNVKNRFYMFLNLAGLMTYSLGSFIPEVSRVGYYMIISQVFLLPALLREMEEGWLKKLCYIGVIGAFLGYFTFLLRGMYAVDVRLLPYLNWIFN